MSVKMRLNNSYRILISGDLKENEGRIELKGYGDLHVEKVYTKLSGVDTTELLDAENILDGSYEFETSEDISTFVSWLYGFSVVGVNPNKISFRRGKYIVCNAIEENQILGVD